MILHYNIVGAADAPHLCFVMHGVLGSGQNFKSFIQRLSEARPEYRFALLDLRYHGRSLGAEAPHTLEACVDDLFDTAEHVGQHPRAVIGHSLGGKVALAFGRRHLDEVPGQRLAGDEACDALRQVWLLDSDPGAQEPDHDHQVMNVFGTLKKHPGPFASRAEALTQLSASGLSQGLSNWLVTSLMRAPTGHAGFVWRFELEGIERLLEDYFSIDLWPVLETVAARPAPLKFELLVAEDSDRWNGDMKAHAEALDHGQGMSLHVLPNAGHWVQVDNPDGLLQILTEHLL